MSDASDLVVLVGELERELARLGPDGDAARAEAATLIPPLARPDAAGWYDRLLTATRHVPEIEGLDGALDALAVRRQGAQALSRRLMALGAVARALPDRYGPEGTDAEAVHRAISVPGILRLDPDEPVDPERPGIRTRAPELHRLLFDEERDLLPDVSAYPRLLGRIIADGMAHEDLLAAPAPCTTELVPLMGPGGTEVAVALVTRVCVKEVTLQQLMAPGSFLNPKNWASYAYWCAMTPAGDNPPDPHAAARYLEEVALDCPTGWLRAAVWLDFTGLVRCEGSLFRDYRMTRPRDIPAAGPPGNGAVTVDEGSLKVVQEDDHLRVTTTKRVRFAFGLDSAVIAVLACVAGYGALAAEFVVEGTGGVAREVGCAAAGHTLAGAAPAKPEAVDPLDDPLADVVDTVEECVAAAGDWTRRVVSGSYTPEDLARDAAGSVVRSLRLWTELAEVATVFADPPAVQGVVTSDPFRLPAAARATSPHTLRIAEPLTSLSGRSVLTRAWCVPVDLPAGTPRPAEGTGLLPAGTDRFVVQVRPAGARGGSYLGAVTAIDDAGAVHTIRVDVQVP